MFLKNLLSASYSY